MPTPFGFWPIFERRAFVERHPVVQKHHVARLLPKRGVQGRIAGQRFDEIECLKGAFSSGHLFHDKEVPAVFLKALFGYNGNPSLIEVVLYLAYLVPALFFFLRPQPAKAQSS